MGYVIDTNSFIVLGHYFPNRFPSFWEKFNELVNTQSVISVREVYRELENQITKQHLRDWVSKHRKNFYLPSPEETQFVSKIFSIPHFQQLIGRKQILSGKPVADPFVIASAYINNFIVVTEESQKENAARIPNVCAYFGVNYTNLEGMMDMEDWSF